MQGVWTIFNERSREKNYSTTENKADLCFLSLTEPMRRIATNGFSMLKSSWKAGRKSQTKNVYIDLDHDFSSVEDTVTGQDKKKTY